VGASDECRPCCGGSSKPIAANEVRHPVDLVGVHDRPYWWPGPTLAVRLERNVVVRPRRRPPPVVHMSGLAHALGANKLDQCRGAGRRRRCQATVNEQVLGQFALVVDDREGIVAKAHMFIAIEDHLSPFTAGPSLQRVRPVIDSHAAKRHD